MAKSRRDTRKGSLTFTGLKENQHTYWYPVVDGQKQYQRIEKGMTIEVDLEEHPYLAHHVESGVAEWVSTGSKPKSGGNDDG